MTGFLAEFIILTTACVVLMVSAFGSSSSKNGYRVAQLGIILAAFCTYKLYPGGSFSLPIGSEVAQDSLSSFLKFFIYLTVFATFLYGRNYVADRDMPDSEYYALGLFSMLGMMVMVNATSLLTLYLGLEVMALPIYAMVALQRQVLGSSEAAMKYFVMGAIASGMLLYGMSMFYGVTGSLSISEIARMLQAGSANQTLFFGFALVFILVGIGFKLAAAPFHMWAPDVYTGAPTATTMFLATAPKIAALGLSFRLLTTAFAPLLPQWQGVVMLMAILSMLFGNVLAITQTNIKRLLAYSAIAQIGYILLGFVAGTPQGYSAALFYMVMYALMSVGSFGIITLLSKKGFEAENIDDLRGLNQRNPWLAFMMLLLMFSFAGIPPTVGFFAKFFILKSIIDIGYLWLAAVALFFAILGAFYYIRIVKVMYFDPAVDATPVAYHRNMQVAISVNGLAILVLGLIPGSLIAWCQAIFLK